MGVIVAGATLEHVVALLTQDNVISRVILD